MLGIEEGDGLIFRLYSTKHNISVRNTFPRVCSSQNIPLASPTIGPISQRTVVRNAQNRQQQAAPDASWSDALAVQSAEVVPNVGLSIGT